MAAQNIGIYPTYSTGVLSGMGGLYYKFIEISIAAQSYDLYQY